MHQCIERALIKDQRLYLLTKIDWPSTDGGFDIGLRTLTSLQRDAMIRGGIPMKISVLSALVPYLLPSSLLFFSKKKNLKFSAMLHTTPQQIS
jgi:hypothetical protein